MYASCLPLSSCFPPSIANFALGIVHCPETAAQRYHQKILYWWCQEVVFVAQSQVQHPSQHRVEFTNDNGNAPSWETTAAYSCQHGIRSLTEVRHWHKGGVTPSWTHATLLKMTRTLFDTTYKISTLKIPLGAFVGIDNGDKSSFGCAHEFVGVLKSVSVGPRLLSTLGECKDGWEPRLLEVSFN